MSGLPVPVRVLHVSPEMAPLVKQGGLGDVVGALPKALRALGADCRVLLPAWPGVLDRARDRRLTLRRLPRNVHVALKWRVYSGRIWRTDVDDVPVYLLEQPELFANPDVYPASLEPEDALPFCFLSLAALELPGTVSFEPRILHVHDWTVAGVPAALRWHRHYQGHADRYDTVLTIHNLAHQGILDPRVLESWGFPRAAFALESMEFFGQINLLKGGIVAADAVTTVSPRYSWEIQTRDGGMGLEGVLASRRNKLSGIVNGIDPAIWSPGADEVLPARFDAEDLSGKAECRRVLLDRIGFPDDGEPLMLFIGRLVEQKGIDLILDSAERLLEGRRLLVVGTGQPYYLDRVRDLAARRPDRVFSFNEFDEDFAHLAYAGSDLLVMPSLFEPCGISQMIAMAYGTIPVVRAVGGLADTVIDVDGSPDGMGFLFSDYDAEEFLRAVERACGRLSDPAEAREIRRRGMRRDFSWGASASAYLHLYLDLLGVGTAL